MHRVPRGRAPGGCGLPALGRGADVVVTTHWPSCSFRRCSRGLGPCESLPGEPAPATDTEPAAGEPGAGGQHGLRARPGCGAHGDGLRDRHSLARRSGGQRCLPDPTGPRHNECGGQRGHAPTGSSGHRRNQPLPPLVPGPGGDPEHAPKDAEQGLSSVEWGLRAGVGIRAFQFRLPDARVVFPAQPSDWSRGSLAATTHPARGSPSLPATRPLPVPSL